MSKEITTINQELLAQAAGNMPVGNSFQRMLLPKIGMFSQDQTVETKDEKGKKKIELTAEAGTFYIERQTDELDENGKKVWVKEEIGTSIQATPVYYRKQLSMYDSATQKYTSSPVYDTDEEILPLFCDKKQVAKGTQAELKAMYKYIDPRDGKPKSKLQDNKILFVLYKGELYQMSLKGTSMYSFMTFIRSTIPSTVLVELGSESKVNGSTEWNMTTFKVVRPLGDDELLEVIQLQNQIKESVQAEKQYFASINTDVELDDDRPTSLEEDWSRDVKVNALEEGKKEF